VSNFCFLPLMTHIFLRYVLYSNVTFHTTTKTRGIKFKLQKTLASENIACPSKYISSKTLLGIQKPSLASKLWLKRIRHIVFQSATLAKFFFLVCRTACNKTVERRTLHQAANKPLTTSWEQTLRTHSDNKLSEQYW
jgi:hypothetical protein